MSSPTDLSPEQVRELWCDRLEDPKSKQGEGQLAEESGDGRCCLGHLADLAVEHGVIARYDADDGDLIDLPDVIRWAGLRTPDGEYGDDEHLTADNDWNDLSLPEIAAIIRSRPPGLFVDDPDDTEGKTT